MNKVIVTLTGPSGSGKSTLERKMVKVGFARIISTTTRSPRAGERDGVDYHFIPKSVFKRLNEQGAFLESVKYNGNYYGASVAEFERCFEQGKPVVIVVEPHGMQQITQNAERMGWRVLSVFVDIDMEVQVQRLVNRFTDEVMTAALTPSTFAHNLVNTSEAFKRRMVAAVTEEVRWSNQACDGNIYDFVLHHFDAENELDVLQLMTNATTLVMGASVSNLQGDFPFYFPPEDPRTSVGSKGLEVEKTA